MRRRWQSQYRSGTESLDDMPSNLPVNLDGEESLLDEFLGQSPDGVDQLVGQQQASAMGLLFGPHSDDAFASGAHQSLFEPAAESGNADSGVSFVEAGTDSAAQLGSFSHVGKTAPDTIISEAIRLTDKKPVLYPWEKGRMARIFGDRGRLETIDCMQVATVLSKCMFKLVRVCNVLHPLE